MTLTVKNDILAAIMAFPESFRKQTNAAETRQNADQQLEQTVRALSAQALGNSPLTVERFMREASRFDDDGDIVVRSHN